MKLNNRRIRLQQHETGKAFSQLDEYFRLLLLLQVADMKWAFLTGKNGPETQRSRTARFFRLYAVKLTTNNEPESGTSFMQITRW